MKLKVDKLKNIPGYHLDIDYSLTPQKFVANGEESVAAGSLVVCGTAKNVDRIIKVTATVTTVLEQACDRCGEVVVIPIEAQLRENFTNLPDSVCAETGDDDGEIHFFTGDEIELLPYVEQAIFMDQPMKILCRPDCKGLCPHCGQNLNQDECSCDKAPLDPRLAVLADLFKEHD